MSASTSTSHVDSQIGGFRSVSRPMAAPPSTSTASSHSTVATDVAKHAPITDTTQHSKHDTAKGQLPDTGHASATNQSGVIGAVAAMLAGLGLIKKSKKDGQNEQSDQ
ncbi:LPXTG cell wall anchor domain-containing protein [Staphylococcus rostri]|nr:LPXTG cell wall anchor domain-containing protein [Staphylococcus rostri]